MSAYFEGADDFVFIDFETTGRDLLGRFYFDNAVPKHDATQVAIAWFDNARLTSAHSYIRPNQDFFKLKDWSFASPPREKCVNAPKFDELYPILSGIIQNKKIVAHNAPFDKKVMDDSLIASNLIPTTNEWIDSLDLARKYLPNSGACYQSCDSNCSGYTLKHLHNYFGFGDFNHHNAIADTYALVRVFSVIYKPQTDYSKDWVFV